MDQVLKSRNLGSATARRQRIQERQVEKHSVHQQYMDRKHHIMSDTRSMDSSDDDSDYASSSNPDLVYTTRTPSESSVRTPDDLSSNNAFVALKSSTHNAVTEESLKASRPKEADTFASRAQGQPRMQATLTTMADWNYDRFSIFIDPSEVEEQLAAISEQESTSLSSSSAEDSDEEFEECSPLEVATPIFYTLPQRKPYVVYITVKSRNHPLKMDTTIRERSTKRSHVSKQLSTESVQYGRLTDKAMVFHSPNSSYTSVESLGSSSQMSRSLSLASQSESFMSGSFSQTSQSDVSSRSPKKKASLPLLFGNKPSGHSRMSSIKKLIRSSTVGPPPMYQPQNGTFHRQASSATLETHFETRGSSMEAARNPLVDQIKRPMTARAPSPLFPTTDNSTTLPTTSHMPALSASTVRLLATESESEPTKPISKLRSRSGSFGQALKSIGNAPKKADVSAPPVPTIFIPTPSQSLDSTALPPSSLSTSQNPRRSVANYSPFPNADRRTSSINIGLGLRY